MGSVNLIDFTVIESEKTKFWHWDS